MKKNLFAFLAVLFCFAAQASAVEFSADMNTTVMGMATKTKIYYRNFKTQRMETMGITVIAGEPLSYQIFDGTKKYVVMDAEEMRQNNPMADADSFEEYVEKNDIKKVGTESIGEYKCDIYEGSVQYDPEQPAVAMKLWYSPKLEYMLRMETQLPAPMSGTSVSILDNIQIGKQPDSLFTLPAGYVQAQSVQEAMGFGGVTMPSATSDDESDEMPSQEEMNQMMQMMQEMMGGGQGQ